MTDEKLIQTLKDRLEEISENTDQQIERKLQQFRLDALDAGMPKKSTLSFAEWLVPLGSFVTIGFIMIVLMMPFLKDETDFEMSLLTSEDVVMFSIIEVDELESMEFYDWLEFENDQA